MQGRIFFFIGTEAELIKLFPVMMELDNRKTDYYIIASGQNDISDSRIFLKTGCKTVDLKLGKESEIEKSARGLMKWFWRTYRTAARKIIKSFPDTDFKKSEMVVHGDTVSTLMGAGLGKKLGMSVCHVEAGLRSYNLLNPFPEEIDRILTSKCADMHFAPGKVPSKNLRRAKGRVFNTGQNTLIDSLSYSLQIPVDSHALAYLEDDYFVFVMHRQENLGSKAFFTCVVEKICKLAGHLKCIFVIHQITGHALRTYGLMEKVKNHPGIVLQPRADYFDFMKILYHARFVITDGGSNQEELYYMGKPCLIMRKTTERQEGIGRNAMLLGRQADVPEVIERFVAAYRTMERQPVRAEKSPSLIIAEKLSEI